jgi:DNA-binding response OmpR family regulator
MERVLIVKDDQLNNLALHHLLDDAAFEVEAASSGRIAVAAIDRQPPRYLVTELNLGPGPDGLDVARYARALRPDIRIVFVSGALPRDPDTDLGATSQFIAKPFRGGEIIAALRRPPAG